jgi:ribosomal protein L11 methyltransferase
VGYWELTVPVSPGVSEGLTNFLWEEGALGVVEEEAPGALPRLRAFFPEVASSATLARRVTGYLDALRALGFPVDGEGPVVLPRLDEPWAEAWRQAFAPQLVGRRLLVAPPWDAPSEAGRVTVVIEPGRAFGTGTHGSTRGCLLLLERALGAGVPPEALDLGAGTGILAIAAHALGVPRVMALDTDPDAVAAARANARLNGAAEQITCALADAAGVQGRFGLILANLLAASHLSLGPEYRRLLAPGGRLILGGILPDEAGDVGAALAGLGFRPEDEVLVEGWASLLLGG